MKQFFSFLISVLITLAPLSMSAQANGQTGTNGKNATTTAPAANLSTNDKNGKIPLVMGTGLMKHTTPEQIKDFVKDTQKLSLSNGVLNLDRGGGSVVLPTPNLTPYALTSVVNDSLSAVKSLIQLSQFRVSGSNVIGGNGVMGLVTTGANNFGFGQDALASITTGSFNIGIGTGAIGVNNQTGVENIGIGHRALTATSSSYNTAIGYKSLTTNTTGAYNTGIGRRTLWFNTTASNNTAVGDEAMYLNVLGSNNTAVGFQSNRYSMGSNNTSLGYSTGVGSTKGSSNTFIGYQSTASLDSLVNATAIGANAIVGASNSLVLGGMGLNAVNVGIGTTVPSSTLQVNGSFSTVIVTKTANYTASANDHIIIANATGSALTMTLPSAVGISGRQYIFKKTDSSANAVTVATTSNQTIDNAPMLVLTAQWQRCTLVSDGSNWQKVD